MDILFKYFPSMTSRQHDLLQALLPLYQSWNGKVNLISRKDIDHLTERHILHSLAVARFFTFPPGCRIADVGTGGGFPGIPLAIAFPDTEFFLVDSIGKKVHAVKMIAAELGLENVTLIHSRSEDLNLAVNFITARAVSTLPVFVSHTRHLLVKGKREEHAERGILYLKGGDIQEELRLTHLPYKVFELSSVFEEEYFATKKLVHLML